MSDKNSQRFISEDYKKATETSSTKRKLFYYLDVRKYSIIGKLGFSFAAYLVLFNVGVFLWKGSDHPLNNFMWRIKKANGTLTKEQLEKERILNEYFSFKLSNKDDNKKPWSSSIFE